MRVVWKMRKRERSIDRPTATIIIILIVQKPSTAATINRVERENKIVEGWSVAC